MGTDKVKLEDKESAHVKFQEIALAYAVLSDDRRRKRYDATGRTDESLDIDDDIFNWAEFFRSQFADIITPESIATFTGEYKGSDEEREALLEAYTKAKGNMTKVYQLVMVSNPADDDDRFREIINNAIEHGHVEAYDKFTQESAKSIQARIAKAKKEGQEAEEYAKELGVHDKLFAGDKKKKAGKSAAGKKADNDQDSLAALIQQRQKSRSDNFFADLEAKYAPKGKSKKRTGPSAEPPEEAFERNAKKSKKANQNA